MTANPAHPTKAALLELHRQWKAGRSKVDIERHEFGNWTSQAKLITQLWREIGLETEEPHPMMLEVARLQSLCTLYGISTDPAVSVSVQGFTPQSICSTPGNPGSSAGCSTCTATCSADPADVDPAELAYWETLTCWHRHVR